MFLKPESTTTSRRQQQQQQQQPRAVIVRMVTMITWLLLVSLFSESKQDENGHAKGVLQCGPQNMTLSSSDQTILSTWEDDPSCSALQDTLIYELEVLIADKQVHYDQVVVMPNQIGSAHFWTWTSHLALECVPHSVRLSSRYKNLTSPWKREETLPGKETSITPEVYPRERVFQVGSRVTFCCVLPPRQVLDKMYLSGSIGANMNITMINNQTYALTVELVQPSRNSCTDVKCKATLKHGGTSENGACAFIGYPPGDKDLQCETRDLESVDCHWTVGRDTHLPTKPTAYQLLGRPCAAGSPGRCSQKVQVEAVERNWTLVAQNKLGKVELTDTADLTHRVHMFAPVAVTASTIESRNVSLVWGWEVQQYNHLNTKCQVNISHGDTNTVREIFGVGLNSTVLTELIPNWWYNVTVRCGTTQPFWRWSDWSSTFTFHTEGDVPDAPDVWMQMKENQIIITWKMLLDNQSHGDIIDYTVTWTKTTETQQQHNTTSVAHNKHHVALSVDTAKQYDIAVTARNRHGASSPSTITTPRFSPDSTRANTSWIIGINGVFSLSWSASPAASCGYIVDWCPTLGGSFVEWLKVPPHQTNATISSKNFKGGLRYSVSIYACTRGAPVLLQRREGYVSEEKIQDGLFKSLKWKQQDSNIEVSWDPISLREQPAFIQGYTMYWAEDNNEDNTVFNASTDRPEASSLTATNLRISSYTFTVKAQTAVGECGTTSFTATLNSQTDSLIKNIFISLAAVFGLLSLVTVVCYRHWACIKQKVYPPIPKPLLRDTWWTSPGEQSCHPHMDQCHHSEVDVLEVPELHSKSGSPVVGYISHENKPFVFAQTPKGYYNQHLKKCSPSPPIIPSQSGLPPSSFRGVFPNPSYNLVMQAGDQQPEIQEGMDSETNSGGYQLQSPTQTLTATEEGPQMSCVLTYISLPQA